MIKMISSENEFEIFVKLCPMEICIGKIEIAQKRGIPPFGE